MNLEELLPLAKHQVALGQPLPWPVYDRERQLVMCAGGVIESAQQLDLLSARGLFRDRSEATEAPAAPPARRASHTPTDFADLDLPIGAPLELRRVGLDEARYPTELVGYLRGRSIVVRMPAAEGKLVLVREGQPVVIRGFSGTEAFSFSGTVLTARFAPDAYLHIEYPRDVECTTIRKQRRVDVEMIASATIEGSPARPALVMDISATGARLAAQDELAPVSSTLRVAFRLATPGGVATLELDALVCSVKRDEAKDRLMHGVKFVHLDPMQMLALRGFIALSAKRRGEARPK